jgi:hypothetical protein
MSGSLEEAYVAVERAYGQGDFVGALQRAQALQPQVEPGRPDLLDQRLQLLIGHIHLYGLNQPAQAAAAYSAVLAGCAEPSYRELAGQGLEISQQHMPAVAEPQAVEPAPVEPVATQAASASATAPAAATATAGQPLPATPWLNQLQNPQQALDQIQQAWATATPAQATAAAPAPAPTGGSAAPWQPGEASAVLDGGMEAATAAMPDGSGPEAMGPEAGEAAAEGREAAATEPAETSEALSPESSDLVVQPEAESSGGEPEDPQAIIPVVVTVEEDDTAATPAAAAETTPAPVPAAPSFTEEEWADFQRGMLLVELTTSNAGPTR